jgi:hypothetical protein
MVPDIPKMSPTNPRIRSSRNMFLLKTLIFYKLNYDLWCLGIFIINSPHSETWRGCPRRLDFGGIPVSRGFGAPSELVTRYVKSQALSANFLWKD